MFEKEAEEYGEKDLGGKYLSSVIAKDKLHAYKLGQYDGFVAGAEFAYNKANEWHKVEDILPPMDEIIYLWHENDSFPTCAYRHIPYGKTEKDWVWECYWGSGYTVTQSVAKNYLWKEMVLPNEV